MATELLPAVLALGATGTVAALAAAAWMVFGRPDPEASPTPATVSPARPSRDPDDPGPILSLLKDLAGPDQERSQHEGRVELLQAGYRDPLAFEKFLALRLGLALVLPVLVGAVLARQSVAPLQFVLSLVLALVLGYLGPAVVVASQRDGRQQRIAGAVPTMMDMLVTCLESGLGLDMGLQHAAREIRPTCPDLAEELENTNLQLASGVPRLEALQRLDERCGVDELSSLVNVITQAERFGAGAAQSIRAQAHLARQQRMLAAEERAAQAAPKLTVAMIVFILPALFVVLLGPSAAKVLAGMVPFLGGGG